MGTDSAQDLLRIAQRELERNNVREALILIDKAQTILLRQSPVELELKLKPAVAF